MTEKYNDLTEEIWRADEGRTSLGSVNMVLDYLERRPDQVPGRTITESKFKWAIEAQYGAVPIDEDEMRSFAGYLGVTVVPDPELPTEPGSVVRTRGDGEDYTLGRDLNWRYGRSVVQPADLRQLDWEVVA